jgi:NAD(P)-dependent dehydrogenase (short-subunit alcohol dehydrogenase family)
MDVRSLPVLVTGANSGIGLAATLELARRGHRTVASARSAERVDDLLEAADRAGVHVEARVLDVTDATAAKELVADVDPYGVVNAAGYTNMGAVEDVGDDEARHHLETMVLAPVRMARLALPGMRARGDGRIVTVSSILGMMGTPLMGWYDGAKHAIEALHDAMRVEVRSSGVRVTLVDPGAIRTPIYAKAWAELADREPSRYETAYHRWTAITRTLLPVFTPPERVGRVVADVIASPNPPARRYVGLGAPIVPLAYHLTPPGARDALLRLLFGL